MTLDTTKPIKTRDGRAAYIVGTNGRQRMGKYLYPIIAEVEHPNESGQWVAWHYLPDGRWKSSESKNNNDIINYQPN